jgi:hypothetical protein
LKNILLFSSFILALISFSCNDNSSINSPAQTDNKPQLTIDPASEVFVSQLIDGSVGGKIQFDQTVVDKENDSIQIAGELVIDSLAFDGDKEIQIIPNFSNATIRFFPSMTFKKPLILTLLFKGIDLQKLGFTSTDQISFVFIDDNGNVEPITYKDCRIIANEKYLIVQGAVLNHFSRYAFIR